MQDNKYERSFSNFIKDALPSSTEWMWVTDIDFVLYNVTTKKFCMIELKTRWNTMWEWQKMIYRDIHRRLLMTNKNSEMKFVWTFCVEFEWTDFHDGRVWIQWTWIKKTEVYQMTLSDFLNSTLSC